MAQFKTIIVNVSGKIPEFFSEMEPTKLTAALNEGYQIKEVHQIATNPAASSTTSVVGVVILTYILVKGL